MPSPDRLSLEQLEQHCEHWMSSRIGSDPAHDLAHIRRVVRSAKQLARAEGAELSIVVVAAWLHDAVCLSKDHPERRQASRLSAAWAQEQLQQLADFEADWLAGVAHAIEAHSFSAGIPPRSLEAKIVQDADRLDALGAIGIARCMLVSGALQRSLYAEQDPFCQQRPPDDQRYGLDHFYTKLLRLPEQMQTRAAKQEAERRVTFMQTYLRELAGELL